MVNDRTHLNTVAKANGTAPLKQRANVGRVDVHLSVRGPAEAAVLGVVGPTLDERNLSREPAYANGYVDLRQQR